MCVHTRQIRRVLAEGRGTLPSGTRIQTVETGLNSSEAYRVRAEWCRDAILMLGLGGTLTATTEAGSGSLAGNALSDSLSRLCARSARGVAQAVNQGLCYPALRRAFPGQPILASFDISFDEDMQAMAQMIASLACARYRMPDEAVSEKMGVNVTTEAQPASGFGVGSRAVDGQVRLASVTYGVDKRGGKNHLHESVRKRRVPSCGEHRKQ